ncbi:MAG: hypothetical protein ACF8Q5_14815 [Phycisphaerales bacterium JB040]
MTHDEHTGFGGLDQGEYDALADLFLGDSELAPPASPHRHEPERTRRAARPAVASRPALELVLLGHLPVRAGLWLKQYASMVAAQLDAPVALLRLAPDIASVDLVGRADATQAPTLGDAVRRARLDASRFILRVNETAEPALAEDSTVDRVTILTGADEAALVASYRLLKSLAGAWDRSFDLDEGPHLRLAIMGATEEAAEAAHHKLSSAAGSFLQRPVDIITGPARLDSCPSVTLFRGESGESVSDIIDLLAPTHADRRSATHGPEPSPRREPGADLRLVGVETAPAAAPPTDPSPAPIPGSAPVSAPGRFEHASVDAGEEPVHERAPEVVVRPVAGGTHARRPAGVDAGTPVSVAAPTLAARVPGLRRLATTCPYTPGVEFASDERGRLHLLTEHTGQTSHAARVDRLVAAAAWTRAHLDLLLRAEPDLALPSPDPDEDHAPVLHLLTRTAPEARALLDSDLRVHLSRPVEIEGRTHWLTDALN